MRLIRLGLLLAFAAAGYAGGADLIINPGFEQGDGRAVHGWRIGDKISSVVAEGAHGGKRCLRIVDPDKKDGSNVRSNTIRLESSKQYGVWAWLYRESGDARGLGVYVDWLDKAGKRMRKESEGSCRRPLMRQGQWTPFFFAADPPAKAVSMRVWLHTFSTAIVTCRVDDVAVRAVARGQFGPAAQWTGGVLDEKRHKDWPYGLRWEHGQSSAIVFRFDKPRDWSGFTAITFNMHLARPTESTCVLIASSENPDTKGADYYSVKLRFDWSGWKSFIIPLREMGAVRKPLGWNYIERVSFTAAGWGQTLKPDTVVTLDGFKLSTSKDTGQAMTDARLFALLDVKLPALSAVKAAVNRGDLAAAKRALAQHIRTREYPRWTIDPRTRPSKNVKIPTPDKDRAPNQWDYYSTFIKLDWRGWKHFSFKKSDFKGPAYVEGKGWVGKKPIGWNWIQYVLLSARGWGLKPDPKVVLYFDDVKLVGKGKTAVLSDFENGECPAEGLDLSTERAKGGRASGKWADLPGNTHVKWSQIPHDWRPFDTFEFWLYNKTPSSSRIVMVLDSDVPRVMAAAERALRREWTYPEGPGKRGTIRFKDKIDWTANPTKGEARTHLWNEGLNRHFHFRPLAQAYWQTGQNKYAKEIADQIVDWVRANPPLLLSSGNGRACEAWQTLTTGIRLASIWPDALYRCMDAPAFNDEVICTILKSIHQQAEHLVRWPSKGNWLTAESNGLYTAGMLFPEFKRAKGWRAIAISRIYKQLDNEVYPDGMEYELATGYNNWVVREFTHILELAQLNDIQDELPKDYLTKIEKCFNYQLYSSMPNGCMPGLNDSGPSNIRASLKKAFELFPRREDFLYVATNGAQGEEPKLKSYAFPWCGHYVMRSGWDADAVHLLFDAGPFGFGHQHEDKLHFVLFAYGRSLLLDPGNYSYDHSRWRRYVISTRGHNTALVDGQGQHRRGLRDTYFWPRPWKGDTPKGNDATWVSTPTYDFAAGVYSDGYGPGRRIRVVHRRRILWVKPTYFIVFDTLRPGDKATHMYESLFHLDATSAAVDGLTVQTRNQGEANVKILALPDAETSLNVVKGKKNEPVQGWANSPWRAVPTAIYRKSAKGLVRMAFVIAPWAKGSHCPIVSVESTQTEGNGIAGVVRLANGETHRFVFSDEVDKPVRAGSLRCEGYAAVEIRDRTGKIVRIIDVAPK